jgi:hypothetical protein
VFGVAFLSFVEKAPEVKGVSSLLGWCLKAGQSRQQNLERREGDSTGVVGVVNFYVPNSLI